MSFNIRPSQFADIHASSARAVFVVSAIRVSSAEHAPYFPRHHSRSPVDVRKWRRRGSTAQEAEERAWEEAGRRAREEAEAVALLKAQQVARPFIHPSTSLSPGFYSLGRKPHRLCEPTVHREGLGVLGGAPSMGIG